MRSRINLVAAVAIGLATLAPPAAGLDLVALRPAYTATTFIHFEPVQPVDANFFALIRNAIAHADGVKAAAARWHAEHFGSIASDGARLPEVLFHAEGGLARGNPAGTAPYSYGVRVSVPVYDGNSRGFSSDAQRAASEAARHGALDELTATLVDLVASAASVRRTSQVIEIRRAQFALARNLLAATESERTSGTATKVDTDQARAQLDRIEVELRLAESARNEARQVFAGISGQDPGSVGAIGSIARHLPVTLGEAVAIARRENPQLNQRLQLALSAEHQYRATAASIGPELMLELGAGGGGDFASGATAPVSAQAMLRLEVPFTFGAGAQVQRKAMESSAAQLEASAATRGVVAGLESALERLAAVRTALARANDAVRSAAAVAEGIDVERELGERTLTDLVGAQSAHADARIRVAELQYDLTVAEHLLAAQIGRLEDIYGASLDAIR